VDSYSKSVAVGIFPKKAGAESVLHLEREFGQTVKNKKKQQIRYEARVKSALERKRREHEQKESE